MPAQTTFEHRGGRANQSGRKDRRGRNRRISPVRGKVGNTLGSVGCTYCNPEINQRVARKAAALYVLKEGRKYYDKHGRDEITDAQQDTDD